MRRKRPTKTLTPDLPDYTAVPLQDAAPVLGFAVGTLRKKCAAGKVPTAFKTSGRAGDWRVPFATLRPYLTRKSA